MTAIRVLLKEDFAELIDSFGNVAAEWRDKKYDTAILAGDCSVQRWHEMFHEMAVKDGSLVPHRG